MPTPETAERADRAIEQALVGPMAAVEAAVEDLRERVTGPEVYSVGMAFEAVAYLDGTLRPLLDRLEAAVLQAGMDCGGNWTELGKAYEPPLSRAATRARYVRCGGTKRWQVPRGGLPVRFDMEDTDDL